MDISSLAKVRIDYVRKVSNECLERIKVRRAVLREDCIAANMEERKSWFGLVTTPGMTREEAEEYVDAPCDLWEPLPKFRVYACGSKSKAKELLAMCEVSCEDELYLGVEHVKFLTDSVTFSKEG